jgi:hypothetical protein
MPFIRQTSDLTKQYLSYNRDLDSFRPVSNVNYPVGAVTQLVSMDLQTYLDEITVALPGTGANQQNIMGVVSDSWPGFSGSLTGSQVPVTLSPSNVVTARGTIGVQIVLRGYHPAILIDQSGTGAVTVTNQIPLVPSRATAGYTQGVATGVGGLGTVAIAMLPASGIGSSLTAAALAQASQTDTLTGTPAVGDILNVTIQSPYSTTAPGTAQTTTYSTSPLTAAQATTVTTAATFLAAQLNGNSAFATYFTAASAAGVVTVTVNALANPFLITYATLGTLTNQFYISISGMVSNSLTFAVSTTGTGGTVSTAGGATFAGGTGYKGIVPGYVTPS